MTELNPLALTPAVFAGIAEEIEDAVSARSRAPLDALQEKLGDLFVDLLRQAPDAVVEAVRGTRTSDSSEAMAYLLGKVSFGQTIAAQAAERRADDSFIDVLHSSRFQDYVRALEHHDLSGVELAEITGEQPETVSRKLRQLRDAGIVEFRRDGTRLINFLTSGALAAFRPETCGVQDVLDAAIRKRVSGLDPHLRSARNFAPYEAMVSADV